MKRRRDYKYTNKIKKILSQEEGTVYKRLGRQTPRGSGLG